MTRAGLLACTVPLLALPAQAAPEYRDYLCRSGIDVAVAVVPGDGGTVLVMAPEGRQVILRPEGPQDGGVSLHVEQPPRPRPLGLYLWRERPRTAQEAAQPDSIAWTAELGWRQDGAETVVDICRRLPG